MIILDNHIDKRFVQSLVSTLSTKLEAFANNIKNDKATDLAFVGEQFMFALLAAVRDIATDETDETEMIGEVIYGALHAGLQGAIFQNPPRFKRCTDEKPVEH